MNAMRPLSCKQNQLGNRLWIFFIRGMRSDHIYSEKKSATIDWFDYQTAKDEINQVKDNYNDWLTLMLSEEELKK